MARTRSITLLRSDAYKRADLENSTSLIPQADATEYVNKGYAALYRLLAKVGRPVYFPTKSTLTTTVAQAAYTLDIFAPDASRFWLEISVHATVSGTKSQIHEWDFSELADLSDTSRGWSGELLKYKIVENSIYLYPAPGGAWPIELWWVPAPRRFVDTTDDAQTIDGVADFEQYVIDYAAKEMAVKRKNLELAAFLTGELATKQAEIETLGAHRRAEPPVVIDVRPWAKSSQAGRWYGRRGGFR